MSILGAGPIGYNDYQRDANWDSTGLYGLHKPSSAASDLSPVIPVTRYACIAMYSIVGGQAIVNTLQWSSDAIGVTPLGQYAFVTSPLIASPLQLMFPNLGPYVQLARASVGGGAWSGDGEMFATNRQHVLQVVPQTPLVVDVQNTGLAGLTNVNVYPTSYFAGSCRLWFFATQALSWSVQVMNSTGIWDFTDEQGTIAANTDYRTTITVPIGAWRIEVMNTNAAAAMFYLNVTPSVTGSS